MIKSLSNIFSNVLYRSLNFSELDRIKIRYVLEVLLTDISKIILLFIGFSFFKAQKDLFFILLFSVPLRINIGGFHMKKYFSCLSFSAICYASITYLNEYMILSTTTLVMMGMFSIIILSFIAPMLPKERLGVTGIKLRNLKIRAILLSTAYLLIFVTINNPYTRYGIWVLIIQTLLLILLKGVNTYENISNGKSKEIVL